MCKRKPTTQNMASDAAAGVPVVQVCIGGSCGNTCLNKDGST